MIKRQNHLISYLIFISLTSCITSFTTRHLIGKNNKNFGLRASVQKTETESKPSSTSLQQIQSQKIAHSQSKNGKKDNKMVEKNKDSNTTSATVTTTEEPTWLEKLVRKVVVFWTAFRVIMDYEIAKRSDSKIRKQLNIGEEEDGDEYPEIRNLWERVHTKNSKILYNQITNLSGFWIKVGQYLSTREDIVPRIYVKTLSTLQDSLPPKQFEDINKTICEQLTKKERSHIKYIDPKPLATASIAQVHRATLTNKKDVVLKVQHRGVASLMLQDMDNFESILKFIARFDKDLDYRPIVREWTNEVRKELDFRIEANNMNDVRTLLEENNIRAIVPNLIPGLVKERILVMDYCEGFSIRNTELLEVNHVDREKLLRRICDAWAAQMHIGGVFNADPHMGNILVSTASHIDGDTSVPILLDFGLTKRFQPHMKRAFARLMHAAESTDVDALLQSFEEMGMKLNKTDPFENMGFMQRAFADPIPKSRLKEETMSKREDYKRRMEAKRQDEGLKKGEKLKNPVDAWPEELILYSRVTGMLKALCTSFDLRYPYLQTMARAARKTLVDDVPMEEKVINYDYASTNVIDTPLQRSLLSVVDKFKDTDNMLGCQICVFQEGKRIANIATGTLGVANPRPVTPSTLFCVFSVSKAILSIGMARLIQDGLIHPDDLVSKHWPSFSCNGKEKITIRHVLSHQAGLANIMPDKATLNSLLDWDNMKKTTEKAKPAHTPGSETQYHYLSFAWICGGIIEHVTGKPYEQYLDEIIMKPLNIEHELYMGGLPSDFDYERKVAVLSMNRTESRSAPKNARQNQRERKINQTLEKYQGSEQLTNPSIFNMKEVQKAKLPSANGYASAFALALVFDELINADKARPLLSPTTLAQVRTSQNPERIDLTTQNDQLLDDSSGRFGLGFQLHEVKITNSKHKSKGKVIQTIGHAGFGGSIVVAIPEIKTSVAFTTNKLSKSTPLKKAVLRAIMDELELQPSKGSRFFFESSSTSN